MKRSMFEEPLSPSTLLKVSRNWTSARPPRRLSCVMLNEVVRPRRATQDIEASPSSTMATLAPARPPLMDSNAHAAISQLLDFTKDGSSSRAAIAGRRAACAVAPPPPPPLEFTHYPPLQQQLLSLQQQAAAPAPSLLLLSEEGRVPAGRRRSAKDVFRCADVTLATGGRGDAATMLASPRAPRAADSRPLWLRNDGAENQRR